MPERRRRTLPVSVFLTCLALAASLKISTSVAAAARPESPNGAVPESAAGPVTAAEAGAAPAYAEGSVRRGRFGEVPLASLPVDMTHPESRTRWDLSGIRAVSPRTVETRAASATSPASQAETEAGAVGPALVRALVDPSGGGEATAWLLPDRDRDALRPGERRVFDLEEAGPNEDAPGDRLRIEVETVGVGWVHLPSGPREVALQRALVLRRRAHEPAFEPDILIHRWVDPLAGVVAEIEGPASPDGRSRVSVSRARILEALLTPAATLKLHVSEVDTPIYGMVNYGFDRGIGTPVSSVTSPGFANLGALVAASSWDFSVNSIASSSPISGTTTANATTAIVGSGTCGSGGTCFTTDLTVGDRIALSSAPTIYARVNAITDDSHLTVASPLGNGTTQTIGRRVRESAATTTPINASETCNSARCGYTQPNGQLDRRDLIDLFLKDASNNYTIPYRNNTVSELENRVSDVTIWLRSGRQKEGIAGAFGSGETGFCYSGTNTPVPEWRFTHNDNDGKGYYFQAGDSAFGGPFACEPNLISGACTGSTTTAYAQACTGSNGTPYAGKLSVDILKNGVVTVPSGHTFNALLARNLAEFCVYGLKIGGTCSIKVTDVRTVNYNWQVPHLGTIARLQGPQNTANIDTITVLDETDLNYGLFPPRTISAPSSTNTTVSLSWDPGLDTRRITGYKVYWDTDSGGATPYAFNSQANPGQASIVGTTATISGLTAGTTYYFTVTSLSTFTDPSSGIMTTYESIVYPTQVFGDPSFVYPIEVQKATTGGSCTPTAEVHGVTVTKSGANVQICWTPVSDPCLIGYRVLASSSPTSDAGFSTLGDVGLTNCFTGAPGAGNRYFLVVARGTGGTGPWGAYGH